MTPLPLELPPLTGGGRGAEELPAPGGAPATELPEPALSEEMIVDVRIDGNRAVPTDKIAAEIRTRPGRAFSAAVVQEDIRRLNRTRKFVHVQTEYRRVTGGVVVIFRVVERPTIEYIKYVGNDKLSLGKIEKETGLKVGQPLDPYTIDEARRKLEDLYHEKGYKQARVTIIEGSKSGDRGAVFLIHESTKQRISNIEFVGNKIASDGRLKTQILSKTPFLWLFGGYADREKIDEDVDRLTAYYRSLGFFRARIGRELEYNADQSKLALTFVIDEGPRYQVRDVSFIGHTKFLTEDLQARTKLKPGEYFDQVKMNADLAALEETYGGYGYILAKIKAEPRFLEEPGKLDLVYSIEEGARYRVGRIDVQIKGENPHTNIRTVLNRIELKPGDIVDIRKLRASERRLKASGLFLVDPRGNTPSIAVRPDNQSVEEELAGDDRPKNRLRGQSPDPPARAAEPDEHLPPVFIYLEEVPDAAGPAPTAGAVRAGGALQRIAAEPAAGLPRNMPPGFGSGLKRPGTRPIRRQQPQPAPSSRRRLPWAVRAQSPGGSDADVNPQPPGRDVPQPFPALPRAPIVDAQDAAPRTAPVIQPIIEGQPPAWGATPGAGGGGAFAAPPLPNPSNVPPELGGELMPPGGYMAPFLEEPDRTADLFATVEETQTGRFSIGVGVNSDAGVVGQIVLDEQNFSITRFPRSFRDIIDGTAWRGDGQKFRIEAVPGNQVQRYTISFREPYLFDTPISFGLSGYLYDRRFVEWDEQRLGTNISFGYQLRPDLAVSVAFRIEDIGVRNPIVPTPAEIARVLGDNDVYSTRFSISYDTRDNSFLPTEGMLIDLGYEQVFGEFDFPRGTADVHQYFLVRQRPDGSGRNVVSLRGRVGVSGRNTPVFENFFAGGYSTLRGFDFRGASPVVGGATVGGEFMLLGSVEYLLPITADDALRLVGFVDFGTVEEHVEIEGDNFRVAPGVGLRITVPGMGPAPIALDFAWAVAKADTDDTEVFSFFVGLLR